MQSIVTYEPKKILFEERQLPTLGKNDVLAKIKAAGICGSDIAIHQGPFPGRLSLPRVLGHEWSGQVIAVGDAVKDLNIGDHITSEEIFWCGLCVNCRMGHFDFCENPPELGFTIDGAHSTHLCIPSRYCHKIPNSMPFSVGALVEPLSVAYNGIYLSGRGLSPGDTVVVIGIGPIGLSSALWARASGAIVFCIDTNNYRVELARKCGFSVFEIDVRKSISNLPPELLSGIDMLIEASGNHDTLPPLLNSMSIRGQIVVLGHSGRDILFPMESIVLSGINLVGGCGQVGHNTYKRVLKSLEAGVIDPTPIITHKFTLSDAQSAFDFALNDKNYCKIQFYME